MEQITLKDGQTVTMLDMLESSRIPISTTMACDLGEYIDARWTGFVVIFDPFTNTKWHFAFTDGRVTDRRALLDVHYPELPRDRFYVKATPATDADGVDPFAN